MYVDENPWRIQLNTLSRDGAIKVCTLIARAIDSERIASKKTKVFIVGGAGKSLIVDAMARDLSDAHTAYKMSSERFVEGRPSRSLGKKKYALKIVKGIKHKSKSCVISFCHLAGVHRKSWLEAQMSQYMKSRNVGLDFLTEIGEGYNETFIPDVSIKFYPDHANETEKGWGRHWTIVIDNPVLKTDEMKIALGYLKRYEINRKTRLGIRVCP